MKNKRLFAVPNKFGENVKRYMEENNISFEELSEITGIKEQCLKKIIAGNYHDMSKDYMLILSKLFHIRHKNWLRNAVFVQKSAH